MSVCMNKSVRMISMWLTFSSMMWLRSGLADGVSSCTLTLIVEIPLDDNLRVRKC